MKAGRALAHAVRLAKATNWGRSEESLDCAYRILGGENPGTGYEFYTGQHPIQRAADDVGNP